MRAAWLLAALACLGCKRSHSDPATTATHPSSGATPRGGDGGAARDAALPRDTAVVDASLVDGRAPPALDGGARAGFDGRPGWLIIADSFDRHGMALARARELRQAGVPASVVQTSLLANLRPGLFVVVLGRFDDKAAADARAADDKLMAPKLYVKQSGAIRSGAAPDAGAPPSFATLIRVHGTASHEDITSPLLHLTTPDGRFDTRPDPDGGYELWVATPGTVAIEMDHRGEQELPEPCSTPTASRFWRGGDGDEVVDGSAAEVVLNVERAIEQNPCD